MHSGFIITRDQLDGVVAFLRVAELRSFRAAAQELSLSPSALSQIVRALEARIGVTLLTRTTRSVGLTEAGERFVDHARPALDRLMLGFEAAQALGAEVTGLLRITVPRPLLPLLADELLSEFCGRYPALEVELFAENALTDIVGEGFDAGVRLGELVEADMVAMRLTPSFRFVVVGAPHYFARHGRPQRPADLQLHRCIRSRRASRRAIYRWEFIEDGRDIEVSVDGPLIVNDGDLNIAAAIKGLGLAYAPEPLVMPLVRKGELEVVLERYAPDSPGLFLYYPSRSQMLPKLRAFVDFARERVRARFARLMA